MKRAAALLCCAALFAAADRPRVSRSAIAAMEKAFDRRVEREVVENPFDLLGTTRGVYLAGYGAVFSAEINLASGLAITPFRPAPTKADLARLRARKLDKVPALKRSMRDMLVSAAASLDTIPAEEQVVLSVTLFHFSWEDSAGLPSQIVMQAARGRLVEFQTQARDRSLLAGLIRTEEF